MFFNKNFQLNLHLKPSLDCSLLVLNFWANSYKVVLIKEKRVGSDLLRAKENCYTHKQIYINDILDTFRKVLKNL